MNMFLFKLLAWVSICFIQMHGYRGCLETERTALLEIKRFFIAVRDTGYKDEILTSWVDDEMSDCCRWEQVKCVNATTRRVKELSLDGITLGANSGFLNLSMFLPFQELESLDLSYNSFYGVYEKEGMYVHPFVQSPDLLINSKCNEPSFVQKLQNAKNIFINYCCCS
ncbi:Receptor-like protein 14 [Citrus sinensis]|nr:Receptor-like protein 14 [Citrus sinensis]